jgi:hypothetical protein
MSSLDLAGQIVAMATRFDRPMDPHWDQLTLFGFISAFFTLAFYISRNQARSAMACLAVCLAATALYAVLKGAWPLGAIQAVWSGTTLWRAFQMGGEKMGRRYGSRRAQPVSERMTRMFGPL